jgi:LysR family transcriptional regulator, transcriptional activator of nhaA
MIEPGFSYRHLHYFWVVANEGGVARGAERLGVAVQTVSAQLHQLERSLGLALFKPAGRTLALTDAGQAVWRQADQIFQLGAALPALAAAAAGAAEVRLSVGVSDGLAKVVVHRLLAPVADTPRLRLLCPEGAFEPLLASLALHRLDLVLADRPAPSNPNLRLYSHALATSEVAWYAAPSLVGNGVDLPALLGTLPVLLPTAHSALRQRLDRWLERHDLRPRVAGEFDDSALMKTFGAAGMGVFPGPVLAESTLRARYGVQRVGDCDGVEEHFYAIGTEKKVQHPLVQRLLASAPGP